MSSVGNIASACIEGQGANLQARPVILVQLPLLFTPWALLSLARFHLDSSIYAVCTLARRMCMCRQHLQTPHLQRRSEFRRRWQHRTAQLPQWTPPHLAMRPMPRQWSRCSIAPTVRAQFRIMWSVAQFAVLFRAFTVLCAVEWLAGHDHRNCIHAAHNLCTQSQQVALVKASFS